MSSMTAITLPMSEVIKYKALNDRLSKERSTRRTGVCLVEDHEMSTITRHPLFNKRVAIIRKEP